MLLIGNGRVVTQDENNLYIENGCVVVKDNLILEIGDTQELKGRYKDIDFIDAKGKVIMPGMINTHHHIYSAFARGMSLNGKPATNFIEILEKLWWRLDKVLTLEDVRYSAYVTLIECIKNGTTTIFDHHASQGAVRESLFTIGEIARELGVRSSLCYEVSDRDGKEIMEEGIRENLAFIKHVNNLKDDMLKGMFGLHASFTLSNDTINKCRESIEGVDAGFHIHVAEGIDDLYNSLNRYNKRVVERLFDFDILGEKTLAIHCVHINNREIEILKNTNTKVVNNPESNMGNGVGCSPVIEMMKRNITVGLGTDGYTSDMFESVKVSNIVHKHNLYNPNAGAKETPKMIFENNAKIAAEYFERPLGVLKEGAYADIIVVDYNPLTNMDKNNSNAHILFGMTGRSVDTTIINGKVIMKDRKLVDIDEEKIYTKSRELSLDLWKRI